MLGWQVKRGHKNYLLANLHNLPQFLPTIHLHPIGKGTVTHNHIIINTHLRVEVPWQQERRFHGALEAEQSDGFSDERTSDSRPYLRRFSGRCRREGVRDFGKSWQHTFLDTSSSTFNPEPRRPMILWWALIRKIPRVMLVWVNKHKTKLLVASVIIAGEQ